METGLNAWIANREPKKFDRVDLPGGWHWGISGNKTGYLMGPDDKLYVGYDVKDETMRFGKNGETDVPGLNLWVVQEMGEKFVRENFMDEDTAREYDEFAEKRGAERKEYEKGVRSEMDGLIQVELKEGEWTAHVDVEGVKDLTGIDSKPEISREEGIALFNRMSEAQHTAPLRDPMGYMTLDNNLYEFIKDEYDTAYNDAIDSIETGLLNGNGHGCQAVLDKLDAVVRKNVREYCLPEGVNYQHLRNIETTPELEDAVGKFVQQRVVKTVNFEKKRSHSKESLEKDHQKFVEAGEALKEQIAIAALGPMDVSLKDDKDVKLE